MYSMLHVRYGCGLDTQVTYISPNKYIITTAVGSCFPFTMKGVD